MAKKSIEIIYQNSDYLVINKPSGLSVTADRSGQQDLLPVLSKQLNPSEPFRLVHRLDKFTSGAMLIAKNVKSQSRLSSLFERRIIKKTYLAFVTGHINRPIGKINTPIARNRKNPKLMRVDGKRGKPAITEYRLLADFGAILLIAVCPLTGRTHQIRVHMASLNMPLAIDPLYSSAEPIFLSDFKDNYRPKKSKEQAPLIDRLTLHSYQIEVPSENSESDIFVASLDKKFAAAVKMLTKHNFRGLNAFINTNDFERIIKADSF